MFFFRCYSALFVARLACVGRGRGARLRSSNKQVISGKGLELPSFADNAAAAFNPCRYHAGLFFGGSCLRFNRFGHCMPMIVMSEEMPRADVLETGVATFKDHALGPLQAKVTAALQNFFAEARGPENSKYRLANRVGPEFISLAAMLESAWRRLDGFERREGGELGYVVEEQTESQASSGEQPKAKLVLENVLGRSRVFRHLHLELAAGANGLQVIHCVMYPWPEYKLPLFSMDMVGFGGRVTLCIADVCPVEKDLRLPAVYDNDVPAMQSELLGAEARQVPDWGERIFSKLCVCVRPGDGEEVLAFVDYVERLLQVHLSTAVNAVPLDEEAAKDVRDAQVRYCEEQLRNDKTRRVLAAALGKEFAERYMSELMFDVKPETRLRPESSDSKRFW